VRYSTLGIQVTNVCNLSCAHCITDSSPSAVGDLPWPRIEDAVRSAAPYVDRICVTGGEPTLRLDRTLQVIRLARELGLGTSVVSNGYWARSRAGAERVLRRFADAGLETLAVSFDSFHDRLVDEQSLETLLSAAVGSSIEVQVQHCGSYEDPAYRIANDLAQRYGARFVTAEVLPFGRGQALASGSGDLASVPGVACGVAVRPVLTPENELFTCCGPARDSVWSSPLRLTAGLDVGAALAAGADDPILNVIHTTGPRALAGRLSAQTKQRVTAGLRDSSICSLCRAVTDDAEAVAELRAALAGERMRLIALAGVLRVARDAADTGAHR
jgi:organic radical activating enzyme